MSDLVAKTCSHRNSEKRLTLEGEADKLLADAWRHKTMPVLALASSRHVRKICI